MMKSKSFPDREAAGIIQNPFATAQNVRNLERTRDC